MTNRLLYYAGASTAAAAACLLKAFHQRPNFYSATVYLSHSNACILILTNLLLVMACSFIFGLQRLLYGPLRPIEIEQLSEKAWYAVLDTLLAMPSFREDVGGWLLTMFALLLAGKVWGWIAEGRVDILEQQPPANPRLFHARLVTSLFLSIAFDAYMLKYCCDTVIKDPRPGMMVIFTFEFAILNVFSMFTALRYALCVTDTQIVKIQTKTAIEAKKQEIREERAATRTAEVAEAQRTGQEVQPADEEPIEVDENEVNVPGWEDKRRYLFGLEVFTDFIKLMIYIFFFAVSITFNGLPMHIMRDVYMTFVSFSKRVSDYVAYRKATSGMNERYADATVEEIRGDDCIICRESMVAWNQSIDGEAQPPANGDRPAAAPAATRRRDEGLRAKKLPCGHILHLRCLKAWLERQQVCPTCRRPVVTQDQAPGETGRGPNQQQGNRGQQPPVQRRPGLARMFNLGPVRIGFLNGPHDQVQNFLNQMQNPNAPAPVAGHANQQDQGHPEGNGGPNLGASSRDTNQDRGRRRTSPESLQIQLLQIEQRLTQEARNLVIEQRQLMVIRRMEGELARLRAIREAPQPMIGTNGMPMAAQLPNAIPAFDMTHPSPFGVPSLGFAPMPQPNVLRGDTSQQITTSHEHLPEGLVLPPGWTLTPLHHISGGTGDSAGSSAVAMSQQQPLTTNSGQHATQTQSDAQAIAPESTSQTSGTGNAAAAAAAAVSLPPTDDQGSLLFVPTNGSIENSSEAAPAQEQAVPPWTGGDWNFVNPSSDSLGSRDETLAPSQQQQQPPQQSYSGKGKGRAVEVEDVPDSDAGS